MRLFGLEITRVPKKGKAIWARAGASPLGQLITAMTPDELRTELTWAANELNKGNYLLVGVSDKFKRVHSFNQPQPTKREY